MGWDIASTLLHEGAIPDVSPNISPTTAPGLARSETERYMRHLFIDENGDMIVPPEILAERKRQIEVEGWSPDHDDQHDDGSLLTAAVHYLWHGTDKAAPLREDGAPMGWPWAVEWWKPKDRRRNLIRAGALCLAENERRTRAIERLPRRRQPNAVGPWYSPAMHKFRIVSAELNKLDLEPLGMWLSGALDDPHTCEEMKADIRAFFAAYS